MPLVPLVPLVPEVLLAPDVPLVPLVVEVSVLDPVVLPVLLSGLPRVVSRLHPRPRASTANAVAPVNLSWLIFMIFPLGVVTLDRALRKSGGHPP